MELKAKRPFYDKYIKGKLYDTGDSLFTEDGARVKDLVRRGLAEIVPEAPEETVSFKGVEYEIPVIRKALRDIKVNIAVNAGKARVAEVVESLSEEQASELSNKLAE